MSKNISGTFVSDYNYLFVMYVAIVRVRTFQGKIKGMPNI